MTTVARLSVWVPPERIDEFEEVYERQLAPLLRPHGLEETVAPDRLSVAGICSRLFAMTEPAAVAPRTQALRQDAAWQVALQRLAPTFRTGLDQELRWRFELYRAPAGAGRSTAGKGTRTEAGTGNRLGVWHTLDLSDGLPPGTVQSICQDRQGHLWFGTTGGGISRYDGQTFTSFTTDDGLGSRGASGILQDRQGNLWFGAGVGIVEGGGVSRYDGEVFTTFTTDDGLAGNAVQCMHEDRSGRLWVGTAEGGVSRWDDQGLESFTVADGLADSSARSLLEDQQGRLWIGTDGGTVSRWDGQRFEMFAPDYEVMRSDQVGAVRALVEDRHGHLWLGGWQGGLGRYEGQRIETIPAQDGLPPHQVTAIHEDRQGDLWFGFWGGEVTQVSRFNGKRFESFAAEDALTPGEVSSICEDSQGHLWFGTRTNGVCRYGGRQVQTFTVKDGLKSNWVWSLLEDRHGHLWFGTHRGGVSRWDGQSFTTYTTADGLAHNIVRVVFEDSQGRLWFGTQGGGVSRFDDATFTTFTTHDGLAGNRLWAIVEDRAGQLWFGTEDGGVSRWDGETFSTFTTRDGLGSNHVKTLLEDRQGAIWFGHHPTPGSAPEQAGVSRWDGQGFTTFKTRDDLTDDHVQTLFEDRSGRLWFGTGWFVYGKGMSCYDGKEFTPFTAIEELSHRAVTTSMLEDDQDQLWFGTMGGGVIRFDGQVLQTLRRRDGLANNMVHDLLKDRHGDVWIATQGGVTRYRSHAQSPSMRLTAVVADRRYEPGEAIALLPSNPLLVFEFKGQCFKSHRDQIVYRYRLRGYDEAWRTTRQRRVEFGALPLGEYKFEVKAIDLDLNYSELATVQVQVEPDARLEGWKEALSASGSADEFVGNGPALRQVEERLQEVAPTDLTVLILGETGTGKGLAARTVHGMSARKSGPFFPINCSAIPEGLVESELFGHEKGAFTGASHRQLGKVELAEKGTLFLDEIGDMHLSAQSKLLHFLEERAFQRVGGSETIQADVRILAATNRDLPQMVQAGQFREDLYFRLQVFEIQLPPLQQRLEDVPLLARYFAQRFARHLDRPNPEISAAALARLQGYAWPGNVRELEHVVQRAVLRCENDLIDVEDLSIQPNPKDRRGPTKGAFLSLVEHEKHYIEQALEATDWVVSGDHGAAHLLGINAQTLRSRIKKHGLRPGGRTDV